MRLFFSALLLFQIASASLPAQGQSPSPGLTTDVSSTASLDPAAATRAWLETVPPDERARSDAYFEGGYWLILWEFVVSAAISILLLSSRISARLRDFSERLMPFRWLQPSIYALPYTLLVFVLSFPFDVYEHFFREHAYGLANQSFGPWFGEQLIQLAIALDATAIGFAVFYAVFRRAPRSWWLWGTGVGVIFAILSTMTAPLFS